MQKFTILLFFLLSTVLLGREYDMVETIPISQKTILNSLANEEIIIDPNHFIALSPTTSLSQKEGLIYLSGAFSNARTKELYSKSSDIYVEFKAGGDVDKGIRMRQHVGFTNNGPYSYRGFLLHKDSDRVDLYFNWDDVRENISTYNPGDIFRIEKLGDKVYYKQNGVILYEETFVLNDFLIGIASSDQNGYIEGIKVGTPVAPITVENPPCSTDGGIIKFNLTSGEAPYQYTIKGENNSFSLKGVLNEKIGEVTGIPNGNYQVSVQSISEIDRNTFSLVNVSYNETIDTYTKTSGSGWNMRLQSGNQTSKIEKGILSFKYTGSSYGRPIVHLTSRGGATLYARQWDPNEHTWLGEGNEAYVQENNATVYTVSHSNDNEYSIEVTDKVRYLVNGEVVFTSTQIVKPEYRFTASPHQYGNLKEFRVINYEGDIVQENVTVNVKSCEELEVKVISPLYKFDTHNQINSLGISYTEIAKSLIDDSGNKFIDKVTDYTKQTVVDALQNGNYFYHLINTEQGSMDQLFFDGAEDNYPMTVLQDELISFGMLLKNNTSEVQTYHINTNLPSTDKNIIIRREANITEWWSLYSIAGRNDDSNIRIIGDPLTIVSHEILEPLDTRFDRYVHPDPEKGIGRNYIKLYPNETIKLVFEFTGDSDFSNSENNYFVKFENQSIDKSVLNKDLSINLLTNELPNIKIPNISFDNGNQTRSWLNYYDGYFYNTEDDSSSVWNNFVRTSKKAPSFYPLFKKRYNLNSTLLGNAEFNSNGILNELRKNISDSDKFFWFTPISYINQGQEGINAYINRLDEILVQAEQNRNGWGYENFGYDITFEEIKNTIYIYPIDEISFPNPKEYPEEYADFKSRILPWYGNLLKALKENGYKTILTFGLNREWEMKNNNEDLNLKLETLVPHLNVVVDAMLAGKPIHQGKLNELQQNFNFEIWNYDSEPARGNENILRTKTNNLTSVLAGNMGYSIFRFEDYDNGDSAWRARDLGLDDSGNPIIGLHRGLIYLTDVTTAKINEHWNPLTKEYKNTGRISLYSGRQNIWYWMATSARLLAYNESVNLAKMIKYLQELDNNTVNSKLEEYKTRVSTINSASRAVKGIGYLNQKQLTDLNTLSNEIKQLYAAHYQENTSSRRVEEKSKELQTFEKPTSFTIVYPNPTNGMVNVKAEKDIKAWKMVSMSGKMVGHGEFKAPKRTFVTHIGNQSGGLYVIQIIYTDGTSESKKVMKR
ncbi:hypothetical protein UJ101_01341 [Flavobacteriaceae bacterium UJ101]|nr:hypothetical protein UJ101_01341 [Flavobacteriaceae bacterium UJ101]